MNARRLWQIAGSIVIAAILVVGWFAAVSPVLTQAGANESQRAAVEAENEIQAATLVDLKSEYENIDEIRQQLDNLGVGIPEQAAAADLLRDIDGAAASAGTFVLAVRTGDPAVFVPAVAGGPAEGVPSAEPAEGDTESEPAEGSTEETVPTAGTSTVPTDPTAGIVEVDPADLALLRTGQFVTIPVTVEVTGTADQIIVMANSLQSMERLFLITEFSLDTSPEIKGTIQGLVYVLVDEHSVLSATPTPTETPTP